MKKLFFIYTALHFSFACGAEPFEYKPNIPSTEPIYEEESKKPEVKDVCVNCIPKNKVTMNGFSDEEKNEGEKDLKRRRRDSIPPVAPHTTPVFGPVVNNIKKLFLNDTPLGHEPFNDQ